jgi:serine protease Do
MHEEKVIKMKPELIARLARRPSRLALAILLAGAVAMPVLPALVAPLNAATQVDAKTTGMELPGSFADLVERVSPAVVSVIATQPAPALVSQPGLAPDNPLAPFFRQFGMPEPGDRPEGEHQTPPREGQAMGSGFIIDPAGYVVTNNHVVAEATSVAIVLEDGRRLDATIVGRDDKVDLALLKVESQEPLPHLAFGDSDAVRVGDWTIAVGNPFGLGGTVTAGIVSARGRDINSGPYDDYLQIDAPINRGNSGGPTFDVHGNVIGINTAIFSPSGGNVGIGFAIPANLAAPLIAELKENGRIERGWLGVQIQPVTPLIAESLELEEAKGALVAQVTPESPAAKAGLAVGDVILALDGDSIDTVRELTRKVALAAPGEPRPLTIWRDGAALTLEVAPGLAPGAQLAAVEATPSAPASIQVLGLDLEPLDAQSRQAAGLAEDVQGVVVVGAEGSAAEWLEVGDVILSVDNEPVQSPDDVAARVAEAEAKDRSAVLVLINRRGEQRFATLEIRHA